MSAGEGLGRRWRAARYRRLQRRLAGPRILAAFAAAHPQAFFVEVGANDGQAHDPLRELLREHPWRGIMVEPVPHVFARLRANSADLAGRVALVNAAISTTDGERPFHHLRPAAEHERAGLPDYYDALGSFSRELLLSHAGEIGGLESRIVTTSVPTLTLASLLRRHAVTHVDLLLLDTEGHDWEIVRSAELEKLRPRLLVYEHFHLAAADRSVCRAHVQHAGYATLEEGFDTWCLDATVEDALTDAFARLHPGVPAVSAAGA
jgi:FkbM family methyltransferase